MAYNYSTFVSALRLAAVRPDGNAAFTSYIPPIIDMAEQKCYSDLDLISTTVSNSLTITTPNQRLFTLPLTFVDLQEVNIINGGVRVAECTKISRYAANRLYPAEVATPGAIPTKWAPFDNASILLCPSPSSAYNVECIGTIRPANLSADNSTTFLSTLYPALFFAAAMICATGYNQDWGAQKDNPEMAKSWEDEYRKLLTPAQGEETKRKFQAYASA